MPETIVYWLKYDSSKHKSSGHPDFARFSEAIEENGSGYVLVQASLDEFNRKREKPLPHLIETMSGGKKDCSLTNKHGWRVAVKSHSKGVLTLEMTDCHGSHDELYIHGEQDMPRKVRRILLMARYHCLHAIQQYQENKNACTYARLVPDGRDHYLGT